ncbi:hypothetical protein LUTEI9C_110005 [Luteimonas sp. 9C]|nr:hypothetical protein LUTEI9C_110005 [Luteimonas sp. 9C]
MDDRLRHAADRRPRQRLHEPLCAQRRSAQERRQYRASRRHRLQCRQFRRPGPQRSVLRAAPERRAGESDDVVAAAVSAHKGWQLSGQLEAPSSNPSPEGRGTKSPALQLYEPLSPRERGWGEGGRSRCTVSWAYAEKPR